MPIAPICCCGCCAPGLASSPGAAAGLHHHPPLRRAAHAHTHLLVTHLRSMGLHTVRPCCCILGITMPCCIMPCCIMPCCIIICGCWGNGALPIMLSTCGNPAPPDHLGRGGCARCRRERVARSPGACA